ncbi:uncharacterized protein LOC128468725 [Spea bombifrons]|uniref:uncharacterized protein LOC128468725 n=1 Tax=Spea bombifrons TaxID=233779 RepID=UPI00234A1BA5|nr:uncharacterized protein LOC128468725 [Spea bombifrons]
MVKKNSIPERWRTLTSVGQRIPGSRFIAFKVPLKGTTNQRVTQNQKFTPKDLLNSVRAQNEELGLIIDLTNTERYYTIKDLPKSVQYVKLHTAGLKIPDDCTIHQFKRVVRRFILSNSDNDKLIGVHCTTGINRTGYLICRYLIDVDGWDPETSINVFAQCRSHPIEGSVYIDDLVTGPTRSNLGIDQPITEEETNAMSRGDSIHHQDDPRLDPFMLRDRERMLDRDLRENVDFGDFDARDKTQDPRALSLMMMRGRSPDFRDGRRDFLNAMAGSRERPFPGMEMPLDERERQFRDNMLDKEMMYQRMNRSFDDRNDDYEMGFGEMQRDMFSEMPQESMDYFEGRQMGRHGPLRDPHRRSEEEWFEDGPGRPTSRPFSAPFFRGSGANMNRNDFDDIDARPGFERSWGLGSTNDDLPANIPPMRRQQMEQRNINDDRGLKRNNERMHLMDERTDTMDERFSMRDEQMHPRNERMGPMNKRMHPMDERMGPMSKGMHPMDEQMGPMDEQMHPTNKRMHPMNEWMGPPNERMHLANERRGSVGQRMGPMNERMGPKMNPMNERMGPMNERMGPMNERMGPMNERMGPMNERMGQKMNPMNERMGPMNERMGPMNERMGPMNERMGPMNPMNERMGPMNERMGQKMNPMNERMGPMNERMGPMNQRMGPMNERMGPMNERMGQKMNPMNERMGPMNERMGPMNERMGPMNERMGPMNERMGPMNERMGPMNERMGPMNKKMNPMNERMGLMCERMHPMDNQMGPGNERMRLQNEWMGSTDEGTYPMDKQMGPMDKRMDPMHERLGPMNERKQPGDAHPMMNKPGFTQGPTRNDFFNEHDKRPNNGRKMFPSEELMKGSNRFMPYHQHAKGMQSNEFLQGGDRRPPFHDNGSSSVASFDYNYGFPGSKQNERGPGPQANPPRKMFN